MRLFCRIERRLVLPRWTTRLRLVVLASVRLGCLCWCDGAVPVDVFEGSAMVVGDLNNDRQCYFDVESS